MLVIGIDPGTASTGYGMIRQGADDDLELVDYGVISTPSDQPMAERLRDLHKVRLGVGGLRGDLDSFRPAHGRALARSA
jgi:hypothetical protein